MRMRFSSQGIRARTPARLPFSSCRYSTADLTKVGSSLSRPAVQPVQHPKVVSTQVHSVLHGAVVGWKLFITRARPIKLSWNMKVGWAMSQLVICLFFARKALAHNTYPTFLLHASAAARRNDLFPLASNAEFRSPFFWRI